MNIEDGKTPVVGEVKIHKYGEHRCKYVDYLVRRPEGQIINETLYSGKVNVPTCVANTISEQDQHWENAEITLMRNTGRTRVVASFRE